MDSVPDTRAQRVAEMLLPGGHHFKFEDTEELEMMEKSKTLLNDAIFSVHHHHGDGDERSIDASFHCLRRKA